MQNNHDKVHDIIKYDPYREYFGKWSPRQVQTKFYEIYSNPFNPLGFITTGPLSVEIVCDTIWNEMSYNPVRFGDKSPFEKDNILSIQYFIDNHIGNPNQDDIMPKLAQKLDYFLHTIGNVAPEFLTTGEICGASILINCDKDRKSGDGYKTLASLSACIHLVASQNLCDYRLKKYYDQIYQVAIKRHPNLQRPNKHFNFIQIQKAKKNRAYIYAAIADKTSAIFDTESRIEILGSYDPPADTSSEQKLLSQQKEELQILDNQYALINQIISDQEGNER